MEPWLAIYFKYYGLFLISAVLLFAAGRLLLFSLSPLLYVGGFYQKIFFSLALGVFSAVIVSSVLRTKFITVSTGFFLIGGLLIFELYRLREEKKKPFSIFSKMESFKKKKKVSEFFVLMLLSLFFFSWQAVMILKSGDFPFIIPERDYVFYADLSEMIWKTGQENTYQSGNLISDKFFGITLYHYFEIWLGAVLSWLFNIESILSAQLLVIPLFFFMMMLGLFSVIEFFSAVTLKIKLLAFSLLFIGGIPFMQDNSSGFWKWISIIESPLFTEKTAHHYWIAMVGFLFILNQSFTGGFIVFLSMIFVSGSTIPGIAGGCLAFLIISFIFKFQEKRELIKQSVFFSASVLLFFFFCWAFGNYNFNFQINFPLLYYTDLSPALSHGLDFFTIKVFIAELTVRIYRLPFELILMLIPFLLIVFILKKSEFKFPKGIMLSVFLTMCIYSASLLSYGVFYKMLNGVQFPESINFFILSLLTVILLILWTEISTVSWKRISAVMLLLVFIFKGSVYIYNRYRFQEQQKNIYSDNYLFEISKTKNDDNSVGVFFRPPPGEERVTGRNSHIALPVGGYTGFLPQFSTVVDLSLIEMSEWDVGRWGELEKAIVESSPFYQFVEDQKKVGRFQSIDQSQIDFINKFKINFAIGTKNARVSALVEKKIVRTISDSKSGERFFLLE